jgi:hypothetical protein
LAHRHTTSGEERERERDRGKGSSTVAEFFALALNRFIYTATLCQADLEVELVKLHLQILWPHDQIPVPSVVLEISLALASQVDAMCVPFPLWLVIVVQGGLFAGLVRILLDLIHPLVCDQSATRERERE